MSIALESSSLRTPLGVPCSVPILTCLAQHPLHSRDLLSEHDTPKGVPGVPPFAIYKHFHSAGVRRVSNCAPTASCVIAG